MKVRIGTRGSRLALIQAAGVANDLRQRGADVELVPISTSGDRLAHVALADFGGKAVFAKEIEQALLTCQVDLGVHSLKDLGAVVPEGLCLGAYPRREDARDVLVSRTAGGLEGLAPGAVVGTSSLRRLVLLRAARRDLRVEALRGNVETRLRQLEEGQCDAVILAAAGLHRLGLRPAHTTALPPESFLPAPAQGVLGLQTREDDRELLELLRGVDHTETRREAEAERAFLLRLGAGCHTPVAAWARADGVQILIMGLVASRDGATMLRGAAMGAPDAAREVGERLADELLARGAGALLTEDAGPRGDGVRARG